MTWALWGRGQHDSVGGIQSELAPVAELRGFWQTGQASSNLLYESQPSAAARSTSAIRPGLFIKKPNAARLTRPDKFFSLEGQARRPFVCREFCAGRAVLRAQYGTCRPGREVQDAQSGERSMGCVV